MVADDVARERMLAAIREERSRGYGAAEIRIRWYWRLASSALSDPEKRFVMARVLRAAAETRPYWEDPSDAWEAS